ncbi:MAG TPA: 50S ribosomal protein L9 [Parachlamydiaceae bacterium]|nr:50S ribosomal protein L9 [Parachlamydiaceae bacterium]
MAAKLLLIEDVEDLGRSGDIVSVKPGFARNFLLPRGFAVVADKGALRMQARLQEEREKQAALDKADAEKSAEQITAVTLSTIVKVDQDGHMYGSVSAHDVAELAQSQANVTIEKRLIVLKHPIKALGVHKIVVKLKEGVTATLTLKVMSEEGQFADEEPAAT